jgi:hypothetical protein
MVDVKEKATPQRIKEPASPAPGGEELPRPQVEAVAGAVRTSLDNAHLAAAQYFDAIAEMQRQLAVMLWRGAPVPGFGADMSGVMDLMKRSFDMSCRQSIALMDAAAKAQLDFSVRMAEMIQAWPAGMAAPPPSKDRR